MKLICKYCGSHLMLPQTEDMKFQWKCHKCMRDQIHEAIAKSKVKKPKIVPVEDMKIIFDKDSEEPTNGGEKD